MKKILLVLLVALGLQTQAQTFCDSMTVTGSQTQLTFEVNNINTWVEYWVTLADSVVLAEDSVTTTHMVYNYNPATSLPYDTLTTCISVPFFPTCCVTWIWDGTMWMRMGAAPPMPLCDSLSYTVVPGTPLLTLIGNSSLSPIMVDSITWSWQACNNGLCFGGAGDTSSFPQIITTDTVKVCYDAIISFMGATYVCTDCDSLVYDGNSWVLLNMGNPTSIEEVIIDKINDGKMYDMLGRELFYIPRGTMYIQNRKIYIRQ